jgi:alpha-ketoglutarate-dependent taurine dioxygenase
MIYRAALGTNFRRRACSVNRLQAAACRHGAPQAFARAVSTQKPAAPFAVSSAKLTQSRSDPKATMLEVALAGRAPVRLDADLLLMNCPCPSCMHASTSQRLRNYFSASQNAEDELKNASIAVNDGKLTITWPGSLGGPRSGAHTSTYSAQWLAGVGQNEEQEGSNAAQRQLDPLADRLSSRRLWNATDFSAPLSAAAALQQLEQRTPAPTDREGLLRLSQHAASASTAPFQLPQVAHSRFMGDDAGLFHALVLLRDFGFVRIEGCPASMEDTEAVCRRIGSGLLRGTLYGPGMWTTHLEPPEKQDSINDTAFTCEPLALHTDATYMESAPGVQCFHCLIADAAGGGLSVLADGFKAAQNYKRKRETSKREVRWNPFTELVPFHHSDPVHRLLARKRVLQLDDRDPDNDRISWNPLDIATFRPTNGSLKDAVAELHALDVEINAPELQLWFPLQPGTVLVFDNHRVLHGRSGFTPTSKRVLAGAYVDRDDWHSALRRAHIALGLGPANGHLMMTR